MLYLQVKILKISLMAGIMIGKKSRINYIGGCLYESYDYYLHITWKA